MDAASLSKPAIYPDQLPNDTNLQCINQLCMYEVVVIRTRLGVYLLGFAQQAPPARTLEVPKEGVMHTELEAPKEGNTDIYS